MPTARDKFKPEPAPESKFAKSLRLGALDHIWVARNHLSTHGWTTRELAGIDQRQEQITPADEVMLSVALSSFNYYQQWADNIQADRSLDTVTTLCTAGPTIVDIEAEDTEVTYLSQTFNRLFGSTRRLLRCYDCGTNARAVFLKLLEVGRGGSRTISATEQARMAKEYQVNTTDPFRPISECRRRLLHDDGKDLVTIMSISVNNFGHVWVIERRYFGAQPRFHHYQSALGSHMLIDFIEAMDYGANPMRSLDINVFFDSLESIFHMKDDWDFNTESLFAKLFGFVPTKPVTQPKMGFSWTWGETFSS